MSLFRKIFGSSNVNSDDEESHYGQSKDKSIPIDELFTSLFKANGGKFIYCENSAELKNSFEDILEENDWFEKEVLCFEQKLHILLDENRLNYTLVSSPKFLLTSCESLIANEGSILFSSNQIKQNKFQDLPTNIIVIANASQIVEDKSEGLRVIKKRYDSNYPTNITTIKYFEEKLERDFLHYGNAAKNLYLLLLEDF
jgi:L-lactate utilization protein LutC